MPSWKKVILSGSDAALNSLYVTTNVTASSFTGSFIGSFSGTSSYASQALTASFASTASYVNPLNQNVIITGSAVIGSASLGASENTLTLGPSPAGGSGEGGQLGLNAVGGTYTSASFIDNWQNQFRILRGTNTSSTGLVAQWNLHTLQMQLPAYTSTTSFVGTASANLAVDSGGNVITVATAAAPFPYTGDAVITGSLTTTGVIYAQPNGGMYFQGGDDAALYDINVVNTLGVYGVQDSTIGSIKLGSGGGIISGKSDKIGIGTTNPTNGTLEVNGNVYATSFTGSLLGTASYASQALASNTSISASHAIFADTASFLPSTTNLNITSISASTAVFQSASIGYLQTISGSAKIIGDAFIILNNDLPTERYAGIKVVDTGSANVTASFLYDGQTDDWFYEYESGAPTNFGVVLFGPEYSTLGSPIYLTENRIPKATANKKHLNDSNLSDDGSRVSSAVSLTVTGSITSSVGFLGNLTGTASYATQALTASYVATASYTPTLQQVTTQGSITNTSVTFTASAANSLQIVNTTGDIPYISVSGSVSGPTPGRLLDVVYSAISVTANATTTIAELPAPKVAGFTFDYTAYVGDGAVLQAGRAGVVKGILRNTNSGAGITKGFQINETTTLDLIDQGFGTAGLQFTIVQDANGTSNQLVAITDSTWPYIINYTLTIYYNPYFS
jgi:hypothetical protein